MPPRGSVVEIPPWWVAALKAEVATRGLTYTDLAKMLVDAGLCGRPGPKALNAGRVRTNRFLEGDKSGATIRTLEVALVWGDALGLPPFEFIAETREQAEVMAMAARDPSGLARAVAAGRLMMELESGERRLDELLARQTPVLDSTNGDVDGRGSSSRGAGPKDSRRQRR